MIVGLRVEVPLGCGYLLRDFALGIGCRCHGWGLDLIWMFIVCFGDCLCKVTLDDF